MYLPGLLMWCWFSSNSLVKAEDKVLNLLGLYPLSGFWKAGVSVRLSFEMALKDINSRQDILPGYRLNLISEDTRCHSGVGINGMYKQLYQPPRKMMILGCACSSVTEATAIASHLWNVIQISYLSTSPGLSDKSRYPLFFRLRASRQQVNPARILMMKHFNWKRVATINEAKEGFSLVTADLTARLQENNISVITSEVFTDDPSEQVKNLKRHDARIIVAGCAADKVPKLFCEVYKQGLYGPRYVWIVIGFYADKWWTDLNSSDCEPEQMIEAVEGAFSSDEITIDHEDVRGIGGQTPSEFLNTYLAHKDANEDDVPLAPRSYDTAWVAALALNRTQQLLKEEGSNKSLEDFTYEDKDMTNIIRDSMFKVEFQGLIGYIKFDENGDPEASWVIRRIQGGVRQDVAIFDQVRGSIDWSVGVPVVWQDGQPPADSTTHKEEIVFVDEDTYIVMSFLACMGIFLSVTFAVFNIVFSEKRLIKMSSPRLNNAILVGCMVTYSTVFLQERANHEVLVLCKMRTCTLMVGFSLAFGALFAKTWRVYVIFMNRTRKTVIRDEQLFMLVAAIVGTDVAILVTREIVDPMVVVSNDIETLEYDGGDVIVTNLVWVCTSRYDTYFKGVIYTIKGLLLIFGAFLAWQTRKVKITALNDSQYIGVCIYNVAVLSLLGVVLAFALMDNVVISYIITCGLIILGTTITQMVIFIPKISKFKSSLNQTEDEDVTTMGTGHVSTTGHLPTSTEQSTSGGSRDLQLLEQLKMKTMSLKKAEAIMTDQKTEIAALRAKLQGHSSST